MVLGRDALVDSFGFSTSRSHRVPAHPMDRTRCVGCRSFRMLLRVSNEGRTQTGVISPNCRGDPRHGSPLKGISLLSVVKCAGIPHMVRGTDAGIDSVTRTIYGG